MSCKKGMQEHDSHNKHTDSSDSSSNRMSPKFEEEAGVSEDDFSKEQIIVECYDGKEFEIPLEIAMMSPVVVDMLKNNEYEEELPDSSNMFSPVTKVCKKIFLKDVPSFGLSRVLQYCKYHENCAGKSMREKDFWDAEFLDQGDVYSICVLAKAAYYLDVKPLIDLTCRELASRLKKKSPKEMIDLFNIQDKNDLLSTNTLYSNNKPIFLRQADIYRREFGLTGSTCSSVDQAYDLIMCDRYEKPELGTTKEKSKLIYDELRKRQFYLRITQEEIENTLRQRLNNSMDSEKATIPSPANKVKMAENEEGLLKGFIKIDDGRIFVDHTSDLKKVTMRATDNNMMIERSEEYIRSLVGEESTVSASSSSEKNSEHLKDDKDAGQVAVDSAAAINHKKNMQSPKGETKHMKKNRQMQQTNGMPDASKNSKLINSYY